MFLGIDEKYETLSMHENKIRGGTYLKQMLGICNMN